MSKKIEIVFKNEDIDTEQLRECIEDSEGLEILEINEKEEPQPRAINLNACSGTLYKLLKMELGETKQVERIVLSTGEEVTKEFKCVGMSGNLFRNEPNYCNNPSCLKHNCEENH
jgi:hypothetical protein